MTIAFQSIGTIGQGTTSVQAGLPASVATGDAVLLFVMTKPDTATPQTPANWTLVADVAGGGGTTGSGVGPTRQTVYFREKDASWSAMPTVTVTNGNAVAAAALAYSKATSGTDWAVAAATGTYGSGATTTNAANTLGSNPGLTAGDWCVVGFSSMSVTPTWSGQGISAAGVSAFGTVQERSEAIETTNGNDVGGMVFDRPVNTGTSTAAPSLNATASAATRGTAVLVRLREVAASVQFPAAGTVAAVTAVSGSAELAVTSDNFNRADEPLGSSPLWVVAPTGSLVQLQVVSNQVAGGTTGTTAARWATPTASGQLQVAQYTYLGGIQIGPSVAMSGFTPTNTVADAGTWYTFRTNATNSASQFVAKDNAATSYTILTSTGPAWTVGDQIRLTYNGTTLRGYVNGTEVLTHNPTGPITGQDYVGVASNNGVNAGAPLFDNFSTVATSAATTYPADGTVAATSSAVGAATALLPTSGTVAATSATTGVAAARLPAAGSVAATSAATGSATTRLPSSGTVAGTSTVTGSAGSSFLAASSTVAAASTVSAAATSRLPSSGSVAATSTTSASASTRLPASGSVGGTSATTGATTSLLPTSGTVAAVSGTSASTTARLPASGTVAATSDTTGAVALSQSAAGTVATVSTVDGSANLLAGAQQYPAAGTVAATSDTTGAATARLRAAGTAAATSATEGSATSRLPSSGTVVAVTTVSGSASVNVAGVQYPAAGSVAATSGSSGAAGIAYAAAGTVASTSTTSGATQLRASAAGQVAATSSASASALLRLASGGTVVIGSGTSAAVSARLAAAGVVEALTTLVGSAGSTGILPPANPEHTLYVGAEDSTLRVAAEDPTLYVAAERGLVVAAEDNTYYVAEPARSLVAAS